MELSSTLFFIKHWNSVQHYFLLNIGTQFNIIFITLGSGSSSIQAGATAKSSVEVQSLSTQVDLQSLLFTAASRQLYSTSMHQNRIRGQIKATALASQTRLAPFYKHQKNYYSNRWCFF